MGMLVNKQDLSEILGKAENTLTRWQKNGMPIKVTGHRGQSNQYDTEDVIEWMMTQRVQQVIVGPDGESYDLKTEEARLKKHQADKAEIDAGIARGKVIDADDVQDILNEVAVIYRSQLDSLGGRLADEFASLTDPAELKQRLFEEGRRVGADTADKLVAFCDEVDEIVSRLNQSAVTENSRPMG